VAAVSSFGSLIVARQHDGSVWIWGHILGDPAAPARLDLPTPSVEAAAAADNSVIAIGEDGSIWFHWISNPPVRLPGVSGFTGALRAPHG
jgi:hypothetical protein